MQRKLILNVATFKHPAETVEFNFMDEKKDGVCSIHKSEWPQNIKDAFPNLSNDKNFLYVNFNADSNENKIKVNLPQNPRFAKHYYNWLVLQFFLKIADVSKPNFVKDNEFWFLDEGNSNEKILIYRRFALKVQIKRFSQFPELVISYEGISKTLKNGLKDILFPPDTIKKVIYNKKLIKYSELPPEAKNDYSEVFPILNLSLCKALNLPYKPERISNKQMNYYSKISGFLNSCLDKEELNKIIPFNCTEFIQVEEEKIFHTSKDSNLFVFGNEKTGVKTFYGLNENGPFLPSIHNNIEFIYICHNDNRHLVDNLEEWFNGKIGFKGLEHFTKLKYYNDNNKNIYYNDKTNPIPEIRSKLEMLPITSGKRYVAIYISPFSKNTTDINNHNIYYQVKYELLKYNITSQVIEEKTIGGSTFNFCLINIAIALLAKLDGIPWLLKNQTNNVQKELIVGVGAFKSKNLATRYIGSAFSFSNNGHFKNFNCFSQDSSILLAGSIRDAVKDFLAQNNSIERLIIHFYKRMSNKDLKPIEQVLQNLNLDIPVFIVSINKTESRDFVVFDELCPGQNMIPESGTYVSIGKNQFLLCNNSRYGAIMPDSKDGYPFPIKLHIQCTNESLLENNNTISDLVDQVYQFSRMYWKSVTQQNLPVTIKYPEMVAEKYPHFQSNNLPEFGKENLWFL